MMTKKGMEMWIKKRNKEIENTNQTLESMGVKFRFKNFNSPLTEVE